MNSRRIMVWVLGFGTLAWMPGGCGDDDGGNANGNNGNGPSVCGNGLVEVGEQCDEGTENSDLDPDACRSNCRSAYCGDEVKDSNEICDGADLVGESCKALGYTAGTLACGGDCTLNLAGCTTCGNGVQEGDEPCDGTDLAGRTCATDTPLQHGVLVCVAGCQVDASGCHTCGNAVMEGPEECEGEDLDGQSCQGLGYLYGVLSCDADCRLDASHCEGQCGDGVTQPDEECDGTDLLGQTCQALGYQGGQLACTPWCMVTVAGCHRCGNGTRDGGEECDGGDLGSQTCASLSGGSMSGILACSGSCHFDTSACQAPPSCGNGIVDDGEFCDGADLGGQTCATLGSGLFTGGNLACSIACLFDTTECNGLNPCGDGVRQQEYGEQCEGDDLNGQTCATLGYSGGVLSCSPVCSFDSNGCTAPLTCGNTTREGVEACDGEDLGGQTCETLGYPDGVLACAEDCRLDLAGCQWCGNGRAEGTVGDPEYEVCDDLDLREETCESQGYGPGTLSCVTGCVFDTTGCAAAPVCGNAVAEAGEQCDATDLSGQTCADLSFTGGTLACQAGTCQVDTSACFTCGNGSCEAGEDLPVCPEDCGIVAVVGVGNAQYPFACALRADGSVWCWGNNNNGQLGVGTLRSRFVPFQVKGPGGIGYLADVIDLAADQASACAIIVDGTVWCWGANASGQLGDGSTTQRLWPVQVVGAGGIGVFTDAATLARGSGHTCAVKTDGTVWCWGSNGNGQLGDATTTERNSPVQVRGPGGAGFLTDISALEAGNGHTCAVKSDGTAYCWGRNDYGMLGDASTTQRTSPRQVRGLGGTDYLTEVSSIDLGVLHTCAVKSGGTVWCWGSNGNGQLGDATTTQRTSPVQVLGPGGAGYLTGVSLGNTGGSHTCAVKSDGTVWCWGSNAYHQLGDGSTTTRTTPVQVKGPGGSGLLSAGSSAGAFSRNSCVTLTDGALYCWGDNFAGQLGDGTLGTEVSYPAEVRVGSWQPLRDVASVSAGWGHSCGVSLDGIALCWGDNTTSQLGDGTTVTRYTPVPVSGPGGIGQLTDVQEVAAGTNHSCAVTADLAVWCWGDNSTGQLGDGTYTTRTTPVQVEGPGGVGYLSDVSSVKTGENYACALKTEGTVWCWGQNTYSQLGDGTTTTRTTPVQVRGPGGSGFLTDVSSMAMGINHACASRTDGTAWCWGSNSSSQLGDGTTTTRATPVQVIGYGGSGFLSDVAVIEVGRWSTCGVKTDATAWCWGLNNLGQLGDGTTTNRTAPVPVSGYGGVGVLTAVTKITLGSRHSCASKDDGTAWCWGENASGQLGDGATLNMPTPMQVLGADGVNYLYDVSSLSASNDSTCAVQIDGQAWCWGSDDEGQLGDASNAPAVIPVCPLTLR